MSLSGKCKVTLFKNKKVKSRLTGVANVDGSLEWLEYGDKVHSGQILQISRGIGLSVSLLSMSGSISLIGKMGTTDYTECTDLKRVTQESSFAQ